MDEDTRTGFFSYRLPVGAPFAYVPTFRLLKGFAISLLLAVRLRGQLADGRAVKGLNRAGEGILR
jgi:hypothetical protein